MKITKQMGFQRKGTGGNGRILKKGVMAVKIYNFPIEKRYNNLLSILSILLIMVSLLSLMGIFLFWNSVGPNLTIAFIVNLVVISILIHNIHNKMLNQLDEVRIDAKVIDRLDPQYHIYTFYFFRTYQMICPFCENSNEIDRTNMPRIPASSIRQLICMHFRELVDYGESGNYGRFVNLREVKT
jgi:hypothetical protein